MINARKKQHRAIEVTDPDLCCAGLEIESPFFLDLGGGIRSGKDLYADRRGSWKRGRWISEQPAFLSVGKQDDIGNPDLAVASKDSLLDSGEFAGVKLVKEIGNSASSLPMVEARRWRHDELASGVDLEAFRPIGEGGIGADLEPAFSGRSVDRDGHFGKIRQKWKKAPIARNSTVKQRWPDHPGDFPFSIVAMLYTNDAAKVKLHDFSFFVARNKQSNELAEKRQVADDHYVAAGLLECLFRCCNLVF